MGQGKPILQIPHLAQAFLNRPSQVRKVDESPQGLPSAECWHRKHTGMEQEMLEYVNWIRMDHGESPATLSLPPRVALTSKSAAVLPPSDGDDTGLYRRNTAT